MPRLALRFSFLPLLLVLGACAGRGAAGDGTREVRSSRDVLTHGQFEQYTDAFQALQALRPQWMQTRGTDSFTNPSEVLVYRDNMRVGGLDVLRSMSTLDIDHIRYFDSTQATARWGIGHGAGVIYIATLSRQPGPQSDAEL